MNLKNFEQHIEKKILNRGFDYYEQDNIEEVEQVGDLEFSATVWGTSEYTVFIRLGRDLKVLAHQCDCPYDWGDFCKHKVAVLHYIRDAELYKYSPNNESSITQLRDKMKQLTKAELIALVIDCAKRDKLFRTTMMEQID
ncbi:MAG: SWIM zinc finger family protein [Bacteroidota bacterium]